MNSSQESGQGLETVIAGFVDSVMIEQGEEMKVEVDEDLVDFGFDSVGYVRLLSFIRQEFEIVVPDADVTIANFGSVEAIGKYLRTRINGNTDS